MGDSIPSPDMSFQEAWRESEAVETVWHDEGQDFLCVIAPHGGDIEASTDQAAIELYKNMPEGSCSLWAFHGFGDDAYDNYHVTSTKITGDKFPKLNAVLDVGFEYCVSFHVGTGLDVAEVGGLADKDLRVRVSDAIVEVTTDSWGAESNIEELEFKGSQESNITNRLTEDSRSGVQVELPILVSRNYRKRIARSLADVFSNLHRQQRSD